MSWNLLKQWTMILQVQCYLWIYSAMSVGTEFIDRLQTTAKSHHRVICCGLNGT